MLWGFVDNLRRFRFASFTEDRFWMCWSFFFGEFFLKSINLPLLLLRLLFFECKFCGKKLMALDILFKIIKFLFQNDLDLLIFLFTIDKIKFIFFFWVIHKVIMFGPINVLISTKVLQSSLNKMELSFMLFVVLGWK